MKHISIVYQVNECADCPFCKNGYCVQINKNVNKNEMSNDCPLLDWGMYLPKENVRPDGKDKKVLDK